VRNVAFAIILSVAAGTVSAQEEARPVTVGLTTQLPALTAVVVTGSSTYGAPQLFPVYRDSLGQPISRELAHSIVTAVSDLYANDGFVKPEVRVDDGLVARGVLGVQVYEAEVTAVVFEGNPGRNRAALEKIAARIEGKKPLRSDDVPDALSDMRAIAGLAVSATTRKDPDVRNGFELVVTANYSPIEGMVRMNNRGTEEAGPNFVLGQMFVNGLFGGRDKLGLIFASATDPEEYLGAGLYLDAPVGDSGTRANALYFRSHSAPNEAPVNLDDEYVRQRVSLKFMRPLLEDSGVALTLTGGFDTDDLTIDRDGEAIRQDDLVVFEAGLRAGWHLGAMQFSSGLLVRKGVDAFGAGLDARDLAVDPRRDDFILTQLTTTVYRRFATSWSVRFDGFAQHSGYVLPDSERFKIGGDRLGRGFEVAEIAGDKGLGGKLELRRDVANTQSLFGRVSAYGFYDMGTAWKQDSPDSASATTGGLGLAVNGRALSGYLELAAPLSGPDIEGRTQASVFGEIAYRF